MEKGFDIKQKEKQNRILEYIIVFFVIMATDTVSLPIQNKEFITIFVGIIGLTGFCFYLLKKKWMLEQNIFHFGILICICCLMSQIVNHDFSFSYEYKIALILLGILIVKKISFQKFQEIYVNIMCLIAFVSIVIFIMVKLEMSWWKMLPLTNFDEYYSALLTVIPVDLAHRARLFGPFWEPGVYQCYLNLAILFIIINEDEKKRFLQLVLFITAVMLTFSTTGYICLLIIFLVFLSIHGWRVTKWKLGVGLLTVAAVLLSLNNEYIQWIVFEKFQERSVANSSLLFRLWNIKFYFLECLKKPLTGVGIIPSYEGVVKQYTNLGYDYSGTTSTTMREFAGLGCIVGLLRLLLQYKFVQRIASNKRCFCLIFLMFLIMLNTEDFIYSILFNTIFFYGSVKVTEDI